MPMFPQEFGVDLATLVVALGALLAWIVYGRKRDGRAEQRAKEAEQRANEDQLRSDRAELAELHREISALGDGRDAVVLATYRRVEARFRGVVRETEEDDSAEDAVIVSLQELIRQELGEVASRLGLSPASSDTRDHSKYRWDGREKREGKHTVIGLIAARFAKSEGIGSRAEFEAKFGAEVAKALGVPGGEIVPALLLDEMDHVGQRERYALADRRLEARYGDAIVLSFDGRKYRGGWNVGVRGGRPAERQLALISHFQARGYPIVAA